MLRRDGYVKLLDFGLARPVATNEAEMRKTDPGVVRGTVFYMVSGGLFPIFLVGISRASPLGWGATASSSLAPKARPAAPPRLRRSGPRCAAAS